jgi:hypothetical protein
MVAGVSMLRIKQHDSIYQVDARGFSIKANGPARVRVGVGNGVEVGVTQGRATIDGKPGKTTLRAGDYLALREADSPYDIRAIPPPDSFERWNDERDRDIVGAHYPPHPAYGVAPAFWLNLEFPIGPVGPGFRFYGRGWRHW